MQLSPGQKCQGKFKRKRRKVFQPRTPPPKSICVVFFLLKKRIGGSASLADTEGAASTRPARPVARVDNEESMPTIPEGTVFRRLQGVCLLK